MKKLTKKEMIELLKYRMNLCDKNDSERLKELDGLLFIIEMNYKE